jgi:hypothetical protein
LNLFNLNLIERFLTLTSFSICDRLICDYLDESQENEASSECIELMFAQFNDPNEAGHTRFSPRNLNAGGTIISVRKSLLIEKLQIFQKDTSLLNRREYPVRTRVPASAFADFLRFREGELFELREATVLFFEASAKSSDLRRSLMHVRHLNSHADGPMSRW